MIAAVLLMLYAGFSSSLLHLGDAAVLSFTTPIFITIGAALYFREVIGPVSRSFALAPKSRAER